jgi:hypothetical protein
MNEHWETEAWRRPTIQNGDWMILDEHGRILPDGGTHNVDYRSHWFCVVKGKWGGWWLLVKHGGGEERLELTLYNANMINAIDSLPSDDRYRVLHTLYEMYHDGHRQGYATAEQRYRRAFVDGRLRKRKVSGRDAVKVWIETSPRRTDRSVFADASIE